MANEEAPDKVLTAASDLFIDGGVHKCAAGIWASLHCSAQAIQVCRVPTGVLVFTQTVSALRAGRIRVGFR